MVVGLVVVVVGGGKAARVGGERHACNDGTKI